MLERNIFKEIIEGNIPANIVYQDEHCIAFRDINPQAPTHILVIPRKVIRTHADIEPGDEQLLGQLHSAVVKIAKSEGLSSYRVVINCNEGAGQTVPHLHLHLLGGRLLDWPPG
ncbi:histidine triad nucleotide-binding protein [bacterium]|nr:histidine triad nucleotide-binding protein [bacterium]